MFRGFILNIPDNANVVAHMKRAALDGLLFRNPYTGPDEPKVSFHPVFGPIGLLMRWFGFSPLVVFHLLRIAASMGIIVLAIHLARRYAPSAIALTVSLLLFADGSGPLFKLAAKTLDLGARLNPRETWIPEASTFQTCLIFAHMPAALFLLMATHALLLRAVVTGSLGFAMAAAGMQLLLGFTHPYDILGVAAVVIVYLLASGIRRSAARGDLLRMVPVLVATIPPCLYYGWLALFHKGLASQRAIQQHSGPPLMMIAILGALFLSAVYLLWTRRQEPQPPVQIYLGSWLCAQFACTLARPLIPFERRLAMGVLVPAALLAGPWIGRLLSGRGSRRAFGSALIVLCIAPTIVGFGFIMNRLRDLDVDEYMSRDCDAALTELAHRIGERDVVLASQPVSYDVPWRTRGFPYVGHGSLQPDSGFRYHQMTVFFDPATTNCRRMRILKQHQISWVLASGRYLGTNLSRFDCLEKVLDLPEAKLFQVRLGRPQCRHLCIFGPAGIGS